MPNTTEYLAFATGVDANVEAQADYAAAAWRSSGFSAGLAQSERLNKTWRQASVVAAAFTQAVADLTVTNVADNGDVAALVVKIKNALIAGSGGVVSFNTRTGAVVLTQADVNAAQTGALVLHGDPVTALGAATKQYVDSYVAGFQPKTAAALATTANVTLSGEQTIDGTLTSATRLLVKNQTAPAENGLYTTAAGAWSRVTDMDAWGEVPGAQVFVTGGSVNAGRNYYCTSAGGGTLNTTAITWILQSQALIYTASGGVALSGANFTLANMAEATVKGRADGTGNGAPADLSTTQLTALVDDLVGDSGAGGTKGAVPAPAAGDAMLEKALGADGAWGRPRSSVTVGAVSAGSSNMVAHGLDAPPTRVTAFFKCTSADLNYAIGDELPLAGQLATGWGGYHQGGVQVGIRGDDHLIYVVGSSGVALPNFSGGAYGVANLGKWSLILRCEA